MAFRLPTQFCYSSDRTLHPLALAVTVNVTKPDCNILLMSSVMDRVGLATNVEVQIVPTHLFVDAATFVVVMALKNRSVNYSLVVSPVCD